jgi:hypothetical protein
MARTCGAGPALAAAAAALLALAGAGCGKKAEPPAPVPVKGRVLNQAGKPLGNVIVLFFGQGPANKGLRYDAAADKDGRFAAACVPGPYKVTLVPVPSQHGAADPSGGGVAAPPGATGASSIPAAYRSENETPLTADVPEGGNEDLRLTVR